MIVGFLSTLFTPKYVRYTNANLVERLICQDTCIIRFPFACPVERRIPSLEQSAIRRSTPVKDERDKIPKRAGGKLHIFG